MRGTALFAAVAMLAQGPAHPATGRPVAPRARAEVRPAPRLLSLSVLPNPVRLYGPRSLQGLVVTGHYADGSVRDLTAASIGRVSDPSRFALRTDGGRRVVRPLANGAGTITLSVPGGPSAVVRVEVRDMEREAPVSFRHEVIPALTKAGCSQGTCHGTPTGKGGFRLSLQGYAPEMDYYTLVLEGGRRRVNPADPGRSLILLKPTLSVPHAGGKRLSPDMPEFHVLARWIAEGAKDDGETAPALVRVEVLPGRRQLMLPGARQQVVAVAHFSDGTVRDVTHLAKLMTSDEEMATISREGLLEGTKRGEVAVLVRYEHLLQSERYTFLQEVPGFRWPNPPARNYIDRYVFERLKLFRIPPSDLCSDSEFIRRAYLDAIGLLPTAEEVRAFLADRDPEKRARLIDRLLQRPEFADFWAVKWADILRVQDEALKEPGARAFHRWIRESLAANRPLDQFVREILTASGPTFSAAPANFFRVLREPEEISEAAAQLFMGVRMGCAKCHNHPFEKWTQDEYYQLAAFFAQVRRKNGPTKEEETVFLDPNGEVTHLRTGKVMQPKLPGAGFVQTTPEQDRRAVLAEWLTRRDNPFFARALANRIWAHLVGRGIVEPVDDFRESNPPVNEALLDALAQDLASHGFDLRHLVRVIMNSRTYQLSAKPVPLNRDDTLYFSHAVTRLLTAEQLSDAVSQVTGVPEQFPGYPPGTRAMQLAGTRARTPFLKTFGRPDRNLTCECEREKEPTLFQALRLITDRDIHRRLTSDEGRVAALAKSNRPDAEVIEELYLSTLARFPTERERKVWLAHIRDSGDRRKALEDLAWVLLNSKEFLFRY